MGHPAYSRLASNLLAAKAEIAATEAEVVQYIYLKLAALGYTPSPQADSDFPALARPLLRNYHQKDMMLGNPLCPADRRIQTFLKEYLKDVCPNGAAQLPGTRFCWIEPGWRGCCRCL